MLCISTPAFANNLVISNVTLEDRNATANTMVVQFNISWDHSWRKNDGRHDAAWVFVKINNSTPPWKHGLLYTAGTNPTNTSPGTNSDLKIVIPSDKVGAFISRTATGNGTFSSQKVRLTVDYGSSGIADTDTVQVKVFGIEMVYIPEGPFYTGENNANADEVVASIYGQSDIIVSKFNSSGTFQWAKRLGGTASENGNSVATDNNNRIILVGHINGSADLNGDGDTADTKETGGGVYGNSDIFVSVFDSSGTFQWSKRLGGTAADAGTAVVSDGSNNVIVAGYVEFSGGGVDLNGDGDTADTNESVGGVSDYYDVFVSVFDLNGVFQWSKRLGGTNSDFGRTVAVGSNGNIVVGGSVLNNVDLNGDGDTVDTDETAGVIYGGRAFFSVFNSSGTFQWAKRLGGSISDSIRGAVVDGNQNIIVVGDVNRTADLNGDGDTSDSNETGQTGVYRSTDVFISVFDSSGTFQWSKRLGGTGSSDIGYAVAIDNSNNVIVAGTVSGNADLNGDADTADSNESAGGVYGTATIDAFISVFNSAGTFQWSKRLGGTTSDYVTGVRVDSNNNILVTGYVTGNADLNGDADTADSNETGNTGVYGSTDMFISVFSSDGTFQWSKRLGGTTNDQSRGVAVDSNDNNIIVGDLVGNADFNGDAIIYPTYPFYTAGADDAAVQITTSGKALTVVTNSNDDIDTSPVTVTGLAGVTGNTSWPNGYAAFYMMKYEMTQGQYVDFLNTLSRVQQSTRVEATVTGNTIANYYVMSNGTSVSARNGIRAPASGNGTSPTPIVFGNDLSANGVFNESNDGQNIAMNILSWGDLLAYADWAGLRPFTELEFEKTARGPNSAVSNEYAWGTSVVTIASTILDDGRNTERVSESGEGLTTLENYTAGPLRVGFAATNATNRISAGAGYYGNMDLSGNAGEMAVTLGNSVGRSFTGTHGDGTLTSTASFEGNATNTDWPGINGTTNKGVTGASGSGSRGSTWFGQIYPLTSRLEASLTDSSRSSFGNNGGRLARTAP
ncbi:MAG: SBBP repeat-containing protein [Candidatus Omnitrophica bacterium]|nr:SBBP repeat-containing protein [Candidatus Omnitrophota bacterium]